jgi:Uri superfamily endonuclease
VAIGRLGTYGLEEGRYAYVGSAMNGLRARTARHLEARGKKRWHIDHLMGEAEEKEALLVPSDVDIECALADRLRSMPGTIEPIPGFGSSDCRCSSHLFLIDDAAYQELTRRSRPSPFPNSRLLPPDW